MAGAGVRCAHTPRLVATRGRRNGVLRHARRWHVVCASCEAVWGPYDRRSEAEGARVRIGLAGLSAARRLEANVPGSASEAAAGDDVAAREPAHG